MMHAFHPLHIFNIYMEKFYITGIVSTIFLLLPPERIPKIARHSVRSIHRLDRRCASPLLEGE